GKISRPFRQRRHRGKHVVGARSPAAAVIAEKKCLGSAVINVRNIEWTAYREAESVAVVIGFFLRLAVQGIRFCVKDGAPVTIEEGPGSLVVVEAALPAPPPSGPPPHHDAQGAAPPSEPAATAEPPSAESAASAPENLNVGCGAVQVDGAGAAALPRNLLAQISDAVLHFSGIERILLRSSHVAGHRHGLGVAFCRQAGVRQP